jgi:hydrogenase maturation protein HypF
MNARGTTHAAMRFQIHGFVQGVGFRPFVYRLAMRYALAGTITNTSDGVNIEVEGLENNIESFRQSLMKELPEAAVITNLTAERITPQGRIQFVINKSDQSSELATRIPPDLAICGACREEVHHPDNRRLGYPFTNCTACGPRYSIIHRMPFDRPATTMNVFPPCAQCHGEYGNPHDRRFHAQTNCCRGCGPRIALLDPEGRRWADEETSLSMACHLLRLGNILAFKGLGGYQLLVRADDQQAVNRLRARKHRPSKPLAVMISSVEMVKQVSRISDQECQLLASPANPIVIVRSKPGQLPDAIAPGLNEIGLFLPTTPLHELLLTELGLPLVATSGNRGEEPIATTETEAFAMLSGIADAFLVHDRCIVRGLDDSVVKVINGQTVGIRLGRGYSPRPLASLERVGTPAILALGGQQKPSLAVWNGYQAVLGQHLGDPDSETGRSRYEAAISDLKNLYQMKPQFLACDLHPDYYSTRFARESGIELIQIQHHHAHAVAAMIQHTLLDKPVLSLVWDGTGYGTDGTIWGGEALRVEGSTYQRVASLRLLPLPGGEAAIRHPNRIAYSMICLASTSETHRQHWRHRLGLTPGEGQLLSRMLESNQRVVWSSSVGRLFDAVASLTLASPSVTYEGELAMRLEAIADPDVTESYSLPLIPDEFDPTIIRGDWGPMLDQVIDDQEQGLPPAIVAARFHNTLARWALDISAQHPDYPVVLAGGCFQNRRLTESIAQLLHQAGRQYYPPGLIPPGDGGLAVGQLAVAMMTLTASGPLIREG